MGVQCRLLGHVRDSTELEERRETRPNGTVLICREYQVCRRCGDREEMYRNEQVLTPEAAGADTRAEDTGSDVGPSEEGSQTPGNDERNERDTARAPADESDVDRPDHVTDDAVVVSDSPTGDTPASSGAGGADHPLSTPVTDDAVILSSPSREVNPSAGDGDGPTSATARRGDSPGDAGANGSSAPSSGAPENGRGQINCTSCGREWRRDATSLRGGDLCPACRGAYIEQT